MAASLTWEGLTVFDLTTLRSTTKSFKGVFFIDQGEILALDDLLQSQFEELKSRRLAKIASEAAKEVKENPYRYREVEPKEARKAARKLVSQRYEHEAPKGYVEFEINGAKEKFSSFKEAITSGKLEGTIPRDFDALYSAAKESVGVTLTSGYLFNGLKLTVNPPDLCGGKMLLDLEQWAESRHQPRHINWWAGWHWFDRHNKHRRGTALRLYSVVKQCFCEVPSRPKHCLGAAMTFPLNSSRNAPPQSRSGTSPWGFHLTLPQSRDVGQAVPDVLLELSHSPISGVRHSVTYTADSLLRDPRLPVDRHTRPLFSLLKSQRFQDFETISGVT